MAKKDRFTRLKERRRKIASERISILIGLAEAEAAKGNIERASRYGQLARNIGKRYNVRLPGNFKHGFCKKCGTYRVPSVNTRVRISKGQIITHCLKCNSYYRRPIKPAHIPKARESNKAGGNKHG